MGKSKQKISIWKQYSLVQWDDKRHLQLPPLMVFASTCLFRYRDPQKSMPQEETVSDITARPVLSLNNADCP
jgi:hypothetical protein